MSRLLASRRLWKAEATESFDFDAFNLGDYWGAVEQKVDSENITKVLYPNDELVSGRRLRLEQQYFFVSCALQDMLRIYCDAGRELSLCHGGYGVQLNDTHPSVTVAELMRLLVDVHGMGWDEACVGDQPRQKARVKALRASKGSRAAVALETAASHLEAPLDGSPPSTVRPGRHRSGQHDQDGHRP
jgi:carbohydrate phosphorylase